MVVVVVWRWQPRAWVCMQKNVQMKVKRWQQAVEGLERQAG